MASTRDTAIDELLDLLKLQHKEREEAAQRRHVEVLRSLGHLAAVIANGDRSAP